MIKTNNLKIKTLKKIKCQCVDDPKLPSGGRYSLGKVRS